MNSFEGNEVQAHTIWKQRGKKDEDQQMKCFISTPPLSPIV